MRAAARIAAMERTLELWRVAYIAVGSAISLALMLQALRGIARVRRRIREFKEELAARQGPPPDPMAELAALYAENDRIDRARKLKRKRG